MPSVWPITGPANFENAAQLVPNWNSIGTPVATPMPKLSAKIRIQKRAASLYSSPPILSAIVFRITMSSASPMVS